MPTLTAFVLAAFVGYAATWYLGMLEGSFAFLMLMATIVTGIYWLAEQFYFFQLNDSSWTRQTDVLNSTNWGLPKMTLT